MIRRLLVFATVLSILAGVIAGCGGGGLGALTIVAASINPNAFNFRGGPATIRITLSRPVNTNQVLANITYPDNSVFVVNLAKLTDVEYEGVYNFPPNGALGDEVYQVAISDQDPVLGNVDPNFIGQVTVRTVAPPPPPPF